MLKTIKNFTLLMVFLFGYFPNPSLFAQETDILMTNSRAIDKTRYGGVKGSPYMFEEWRKGKVISANADIIEGILLNFNGETNGFEIKKGNNFIELDPKWYIRVVIEGEKEEGDIIFQKNFIPPLKDKFTRIVFKGKRLSVVENFISKIEIKIFNNVGKNEEFKKFYSKTNYYLIKDKKPISFRLKKKNVLALLEHKIELEAYLKNEKMKLNNEEELVKLLQYYDAGDFND